MFPSAPNGANARGDVGKGLPGRDRRPACPVSAAAVQRSIRRAAGRGDAEEVAGVGAPEPQYLADKPRRIVRAQCFGDQVAEHLTGLQPVCAVTACRGRGCRKPSTRHEFRKVTADHRPAEPGCLGDVRGAQLWSLCEEGENLRGAPRRHGASGGPRGMRRRVGSGALDSGEHGSEVADRVGEEAKAR